MKIQLDEILKAFELNNPYLKFYLNKDTGKLALVTEIPGDDTIENEVTQNPSAYLKLPTQEDLDLPEMIKGFVPYMKDPKQREAFQQSIDAGKSFAQLEKELKDMKLAQFWYTFQHGEFRKIAKKWCEDNGIEYEE